MVSILWIVLLVVQNQSGYKSMNPEAVSNV